MPKLFSACLAMIFVLVSSQIASAVAVQWDPDDGDAREWNTTLDNWTAISGGVQTTYSNDNTLTRFRNGTSSNGGGTRLGNVFIGVAGSPVDVTPGAEVLLSHFGI